MTRHQSVWTATHPLPRFEPLEHNVQVDVCVVGAGMAGLTTAYLLARAGRRVLVVERRDPKTQEAEILGVGRLTKLHDGNEAEFALTVSDQWQGHGLGTQLLKLLVQVGRDEKLERITAIMLADNHEMQNVARKAGFQVEHIRGESEYRAELAL